MLELFPETATLKAISLWEPWASLVARGVKRHETRHWSTPYRGRIAIHAAKTLDLAGAPDELCRSALDMFWQKNRPAGAVLAVAELKAVHAAPAIRERLTRADLAAGNFSTGRFAWELANVRALRKPIPLTGRQGLFNWTPPEDLDTQLGPVLDHAAICRSIGWGHITTDDQPA